MTRTNSSGSHSHDLPSSLDTKLADMDARLTAHAAWLAELEDRIVVLEAVPAPPPPSAGLRLVGFGAHALDNLGSAEYEVNTLSGTGPGSFPAAVAWLNAGNSGRVWFSVDGTIALGNAWTYIEGTAHDFLIDGRGASITFTGGPIMARNGAHHFAFVNLRHRGGGSSGDNFNAFEGCHDFAWVNLSCSGAYDEAISNTSGCWNYSVIDCLVGDGNATHDYGSLNYGWKADQNGPGSFIRNVWVGKVNRCPTLRYRGDPEDGSPDSSAPDPREITYDVINNVAVNCTWPLTAYLGAKVNSLGSYNAGNGHPETAGSGAVIGTTFPVPAWAREGITIRSAADARAYAIANAGCRPLDAADAALLGAI